MGLGKDNQDNSREELYELNWSNSMIKVATLFNVSDAYLARVFSLLHVPKPSRGYWAKRAVGKAPPLLQIRHSPKSPQISRDCALKMRVHRLIQGAKGHFESGRPIDEDEYLRP